MARFKDAQQILAAAEQWRDRCLLGEGSLFTERPLWTRENFEELDQVYGQAPSPGGTGTFTEKLERVLDPASKDAKCLFAEMAWVVYLIDSNTRADTKIDRISTIWRWSGRDVPHASKLLDDDLLRSGVVHVAHHRIQRNYEFLVMAMLGWRTLADPDRVRLLGDPWSFASWLDGTEAAQGSTFRHAMLFLLFPDKFEPIVSANEKKTIVKRLREDDAPETPDPVDLDRALLAIRRRLEDEHPGEELHFYRSPVKELWQDPPPKPQPPPKLKKVREKERPVYRAATYLPSHAHQDLFLPPTHFDRLITSIKSRKNLILQGPPGTGKTFIARRIAWCLIGHKDEGPIEMVQFHQSYAYEDFVEGFRPTETGGFTLKPGVFRRFCDRARANPKPSPTSSSSTRSTGATCHASSASFSC